MGDCHHTSRSPPVVDRFEPDEELSIYSFYAHRDRDHNRRTMPTDYKHRMRGESRDGNCNVCDKNRSERFDTARKYKRLDGKMEVFCG